LGSGYAVAVDAAGHVYTTGSFEGTFDFDPGPGTYTIQTGGKRAIDVDAYVSELDANGNFVAAADFHDLSTVFNSGEGIAVDNTSPGSPNVYTTGGFHGTMDFDPTAGTYPLTANNTAIGGRDTFVSKLTQPASPLRATRVDVALTASTSADQALASMLVPGSVTVSAPLVADGSSPGQTASLLVTKDVLGTALERVQPTTTQQPVLSHSPSAATLDRLFADLWSGGLADALLTPSA
jgi:hypothetical protein